MKPLSIRWRLTLWYAGALAVVLTAFCVLLHVLARQQLLARTDAALREELHEMTLEVSLARHSRDFAEQIHTRFYRHDIYDFLVADGQGTILFASSGLPPAEAALLVPDRSGKGIVVSDRLLTGGRSLRIAGTTVDSFQGPVTVQALTSLAPLQAELRMLQLLMIILLPLGVLLALAGGYFLAVRALAPVEQMVRVAETITIANLHQRIEVNDRQDELGHLASTLNSLVARLERAVGEIRRFTADASHELRTPLAVLRSEAESALRRRRSPEEYEQTLATVVEEATRLGCLADQLLNLSRHDAGITDCRRDVLRPDAVLRDVVDKLRPLAENSGVDFDISGVAPCEVSGDGLLLGQAVFNVVENAVKYTPRGGEVALRCGLAGGHVVLEIQDTGIGIPADHLPRVFDRFYRVDPSRHSRTGGAGLGLAIARAAVEVLGGTIEVQSEPGAGTMITICMPGRAADEAAESDDRPPPRAVAIAGPMSVGHRCLVAAVVTGLIGGSACQKPAASSTKPPPAPASTSHPVSESDLNTITLTEKAVERLGLATAVVAERNMLRTRPYGSDIVLPTGSTVIVSAPLAGKVTAIAGKATPKPFVEVGQPIQEGHALFDLLPLLSPERSVLTPAERIRFAEAKNALAQSRIDAEGLVQQAAVQVEAAKIALERAERLLREKAGTVRAVDEATAQLQLAEKTLAAVTTRKQLVDGVNLDEEAGTLEPIPIPSPLSGIVRTLQVRPDELVAAGAPLFEVMNDELLWVKVPVYVGDLAELDLARPARITMLDGRHAEGDVFVPPAALPPTALPLAAAVDVYYLLPNPQRTYQPGQKVAAHLPLRGKSRQVALPWSAVIHDVYGGQWVYEQTGTRQYVRRRVDVGWVAGDWAAIRRGILPGVSVVTAGAAELAGTEFGFAK